jgi:hypothetical protein
LPVAKLQKGVNRFDFTQDCLRLASWYHRAPREPLASP